jgi:3,4-dihydroxy 2-butanone 4-phosphate synthase/GTP cyclohydrolase II
MVKAKKQPHDDIYARIAVSSFHGVGVRAIRPITNNPKKLVGLEGYGIKLGERVPIISPATTENADYLETKRTKLGHLRAV